MKTQLNIFAVCLLTSLIFLACGGATTKPAPESTTDESTNTDGANDSANEAEITQIDITECEGVDPNAEVTAANVDLLCECFQPSAEDCEEAKELCAAQATNLGECADAINEEIADQAADSSDESDEEDGEMDLGTCENGIANSDPATSENLALLCACTDPDGANNCAATINDTCQAAATLEACMTLLQAGPSSEDGSGSDAGDSGEPDAGEPGAGEPGSGEGDVALDISQCTNGLLETDDMTTHQTEFCDCFDPDNANNCDAMIGDFCGPISVGECITLVNASPAP